MLKPTRTILALAAGSMVLGLFGAGVAVADDGPLVDGPAVEEALDGDSGYDEYDEYDDGSEYDEYDDEQSGAQAAQKPGSSKPQAQKPGSRKPAADGPVTYPKPKYSLGKVVSRGPLKVRSKPTTHSKPLYKVHPHQKLSIVCKTHGEKVDGNNLWYLLEHKKDKKPVDATDGMNGLDGLDATEGTDGKRGAQVRKYDYKHAWVSARYVKDITPVKWCRF
ncbi:hypothetical protein ACIPW5_02400 [Streptomyces sp. NPDC090077]|uniref:hypothetical protein n=1 Tax=Streptomyces sp. NPDC090077 TaxID=3365938 RepID=UPI00380B89A5